jgi:hypothetical protein
VGVLAGAMVIPGLYAAPNSPSNIAAESSAPATPPAERPSGVVAGVHTTAANGTPPPVSLAVTPDARRKPVMVPVVARPKPKTLPINSVPGSGPQMPGPAIPPPADTPVPPDPQVPETIVVNLKGPLTFSLRLGERSRTLSYRLLDGPSREWRASLASQWQNDQPDSRYHVWGTILADRPSTPYIGDHIDFVLTADDMTLPGKYDVKFTLVIREGVELEVPVLVTVLDPAAPNQPPAVAPDQPIQLRLHS